MSIATAITALQGRVEDAYDALEAKGATIPATKNTTNLPSTIATIPTGGTSNPLTRFVYNASGAYYEQDIVGQLTSISLPNGSVQTIYYCSIGSDVTSIGQETFKNANALILVDIPNTVTSIGNYAFQNCAKLATVEIPNSVTSIGQYSFSYCTLLKKVKIGNGLTSIGDYAFCDLSHLTSITIPDSVTSIGSSAFYGCTGLTNVTIPDSVTSIGYGAFQGCATNFTITLEGKTVAQIQAMNPTDWFGWSDMTVTLVGTDGSYQLVISCFKKGTKIMLADGTEKKIEDLTYNDELKVWDFDNGCLSTAPICWLTRDGLHNDHYYRLTFSDGTILEPTGRNSNHKIYNVDKHKFEGVDKTQIGDRIYSINGVVTVTDKQYVNEECEYYNVMTTGKINCFAEGILASDRYGNMYPIDANMKYIKDGRTIRPYSDYEAVGISRYWYDNLRLGEVPETVEETKNYVMKVVNQMLPLPTGDAI